MFPGGGKGDGRVAARGRKPEWAHVAILAFVAIFTGNAAQAAALDPERTLPGGQRSVLERTGVDETASLRVFATEILPGVHGPEMRPMVSDLFEDAGMNPSQGTATLPVVQAPASDAWRDRFIDTMVTGSIAPQVTRWLTPASGWARSAAQRSPGDEHLFAGMLLVGVSFMAAFSFGLWRWQVRGLMEARHHG